MNQENVRVAAQFLTRRRWRSRLRKVLIVLGCLVVFCTTYALMLPAITVKNDMYCTLEEHSHTVQCYTQISQQPTVLDCTELSLGVHSHNEACYDASGALTCATADYVAHSHDASCYDAEGTLVCTLPEREVHTHGDDCYALVAPTTDEQSTEVPFEKVLVCTMPIAQTHIHSEACFRQMPAELTCTLEENEEHTHSELCYGTWELTCSLQEHMHNHACLADPNADVESEADWTSTFSQVQLTGDWRSDVLSIARTQLGYSESTKNYVVNEHGVQRGYTRYGQWYGDPYGDWCAMFTSFCMHYAQVDSVPLNAACTPWIEELKALKIFRTTENYTPRPADLIFYDWEGDGLSDHVGFVYEIKGEGENRQIVAIEGNSSNKVQYVTYNFNDSRIAGFGILDNRHLGYTSCTLQAHSHIDTCYGADGALVCALEAHEHIDACGDYQLVYNDKTLRAVVTIDREAELPEDVILKAESILPLETENAYDSMYTALNQQITDPDEHLDSASFYDLKLYSEGEIFELSEELKVDINLQFHEPVFEASTVKNSNAMYAYVLHEEQVRPTRNESLPAVYRAEPATGETILEPEQGVTGIMLRSGSLETVALAATSQTVTGQFWERVDATSELTSGGTYMIVSVQGNNALRANTSNSSNYKAVTLRSIKDNEKYYTIDGSDDNLLRWKFTKSGNNWTIRSVGNSSLYLVVNNNTVVRNRSSNVTLTRIETEKVWRFGYSSYTLRNSGTNFSRSSSEDPAQHYTSANYYYNASMLIFKLVDAELEIRDDVDNGLKDSSGDGADVPEKPDYGDFITPSSGKTGDTSLVKTDDTTVKIEGTYHSDPATSNIEQYFREDNYTESEHNDGKVMTDKSVIYGTDDYGAFDSYDPNTFSVTMSALGQDYKAEGLSEVKIPIDVVFIIDVSGSMTVNGIDGSDGDRIVNTVAATNAAIAKIMEENDENRVGVAIYSGGAWELLPLDRYTATNNQFFQAKMTDRYHSATKQTITGRNFMVGGSTLKNDDGKSFANVGSTEPQGIGTFTQGGIAVGQKIFEANEDTTYTTTIGFDDYEHEYVIQRQPVFILLSDGEPTYSTTNYMDPMSGPFYGDGAGKKENAEGVHGYYTVLTANYAKRMVGIHYQREPFFFTVGMGIKSDSDEPNVGSPTGENYKRAVLNPERSIIETLDSPANINPDTTTKQLREMLLNQYKGGNLDVTVTWPEEQLGIPHTIIPVLQGNPYYEDFSYTNAAYFGELGSKELEEIFGEFIRSSLHTTTYGFILYKNSAIYMHDNIGEGMEIKGLPVLRYSGVNFYNPSVSTVGNVTYYTFTGTFKDPYIPGRTVDVSNIIVSVTRNDDGTQTVTLEVLDTFLPTYTPQLLGENAEDRYYYEALPLRLIYQVGLTAESEEKILALQQTGGELTFYANRWDSDDVTASSDLYPSEKNPYYQEVNEDDDVHPYYHEHHDVKTENLSGTRPDFTDCNCSQIVTTSGDEIMRIHHYLGNNGKLVFKASIGDIPVEKSWISTNPETKGAVKMNLYKVVTDEYGNNVGTLLSVIEVGNDTDWKGLFTDIPADSEQCIYAVVETPVVGYQTFYDKPTVRFSVGGAPEISGVVVDMTDERTVQVLNAPAIDLPATGSSGMEPVLLVGVLLIIAGGTAWVFLRKKRKKVN